MYNGENSVLAAAEETSGKKKNKKKNSLITSTGWFQVLASHFHNCGVTLLKTLAANR